MQEGHGQEISKDGRCFELYGQTEWETLLQDAGFLVEQSRLSNEHTDTRVERGREVKWIVTIARKI
jgi:hypothetical protein